MAGICQTTPHAPSTSWPKRTPPQNQADWCSENFEPLDFRLQRLVSTPNDSFWVFQPCSCQLVHPSGSPSAPVPHFGFPMVDVDASMVEQAPLQDVVHVRDPLKFTNDIDVIKESTGVFLVIRPNPMLHFAPFLSTHFFPCLNPIFKNGSFLYGVVLVSVTLLDSNPRPSAEKRSNLAPTPSSSLARTTTIELPECQERRGAKTI